MANLFAYVDVTQVSRLPRPSTPEIRTA